MSILRVVVRLIYKSPNRANKEIVMEYVLFIYDGADPTKLSAAEMGQMHQAYMAFTQDLTKSGKNKGGNALEPSSTATTVRVRSGKTSVTDGPYAETKEQLGGYYLVEAKDLDEAISIAARIPGAKYGAIEVRPVRKIEM
jgi:hypothetical protein